jgi:hypothetical protein
MGVDISACTIIGMRVDGNKVMVSNPGTYNACQCIPKRSPEDGEKFCPKCGKPTRLPTDDRIVDKRFPFTREDLFEGEARLDGYQIFTDMDLKYFYFAIVPPARPFNVRNDYDVMAPFPFFSDEQVQKFNSAMFKYGIFDPEKLGVWTVVRYS